MNAKPVPPHVHIETFGCQMNEYDSELVRTLLKRDGYAFTEDRECADIILMNTCAIREHAHTKVYTHLSDLKALKKNRHLVVGVLGCMAQNLKEELTRREPLVDVLAGPDSYRQLPMLIRNALCAQEEGDNAKGLAVDLSEYETYEDIVPERVPGVLYEPFGIVLEPEWVVQCAQRPAPLADDEGTEFCNGLKGGNDRCPLLVHGTDQLSPFEEENRFGVEKLEVQITGKTAELQLFKHLGELHLITGNIFVQRIPFWQ